MDVNCMRRRLYTCVFCRAQSLVVWLFKFCFSSLLFCRHLFFICDPACAVVLRMSSVTPQKIKALCAEHSAEIGDLWSLEEWLELLTDLSRVWDWKDINMSLINMCLAKLQTCGIFRVTRQGQSWHVRITDIPLYSYYTFIFELTISTKLQTFSCTLCTHDFVLQSDWHYQI